MEINLEKLIQDEISSRVDALHDDATPEFAIEEIVRIAQAPVLKLCELAGPKSIKVNLGIARILGRVASRHAIPALAGLLENSADEYKMVRHAAMRAMAQIGGVEALDIIEGIEVASNTELSAIRSDAAKQVRAGIAFQFAGDTDSAPDAENAHDDLSFKSQLTHSGTQEYSLCDLTFERVRTLAIQELESCGSINRYELINRISILFGKTYLIRVRKFVNQTIYPLVQQGRLRLDGDLIAWND